MMLGSSSSSLESMSRSCEELRLSIIDDGGIFRLSEDVLFEIFVRLPVESIFKSKFVSKKWFYLLSSPMFKTRLLNSRFNPPIPWALFYGLSSSVTKSVSTASPVPHALSDHDGFSFRFLYSHNERRNIYLLASSNGLVLCSTNTTFQKNYFVCNPLTKEWVSLPQPPTDKAWVLHGFICESSSLTRTIYKVVRILGCRDRPWTNFTIEMFWSDTGVWDTYKVSCPQEITMRYPFLSNVVIRNEVLYWIEGRNRMIVYDLNSNKENGAHQCRLIDLPDVKVMRDDYRCLWESEGFIIFSQCKSGELSFWVLEEDCLNEGWVWRLLHEIKIKDMLTENCDSKLEEIIELASSEMLNLKPLAFNPVNPNVVILVLPRKREHCFTYNIRTRRLEMLDSRGSPYSYASGEVFPFVVMPKSTSLPSLCYQQRQTLPVELVGDLRTYYYFD